MKTKRNAPRLSCIKLGEHFCFLPPVKKRKAKMAPEAKLQTHRNLRLVLGLLYTLCLQRDLACFIEGGMSVIPMETYSDMDRSDSG